MMDSYLLHEQACKLLSAVIDAFSVRGINNPNEGIGLLKIILPVRAEGFLSSDVPWPPRLSQGSSCGKQIGYVHMLSL